MKSTQIAVQLYTVRDYCTSTLDLTVTARKLRDIGYVAVQLSGMERESEAELVKIMGDAGLVICSAHQPSLKVVNETERCIDSLQKLGCKLAAYPSPKEVDFASGPSVAAWIRRLAIAGKKYAEAGLTLGYHNHGIEFVKVGDMTVLEMIYRDIEPRHLASELDTYWVQFGGGDVLKWCRAMRERMPFIHLKDYAFTIQGAPAFAELGAGTLPMREIIAEAAAGGCTWFVVEQDTCPGDPFESLRRSYEFLETITSV